MSLVQLAPQVWVLPPDPDPTRVCPAIGVICTTSQTILIDAGNGDHHARLLMTALEKIGAPPVEAIVYTHYHWDHVFGARLFDVPVIAHEQTRTMLLQTAKAPWNSDYLQEEIAREPLLRISYEAIDRAMEDWHAFKVRLPTMTFSQRMRLHLDNVTIVLEHVGGQHAADSVIVRIPEQRLLFLGDCFYPPPLHERPPNATLDRAMLSDFAADERVDIYVQGHGPHATTAEVHAFLATQGR